MADGISTVLLRDIATMRRTCSVDGCDRKADYASGLCAMHHLRVKSGKPVGGAEPIRTHWKGQQCSVEGCERNAVTKGMCGMHYQRHLRGNLTPAKAANGTWSGTKCTVSGCDREAVTKGMCETHRQRVRKGLRLEAPIKVNAVPYGSTKCSFDGCNQKAQRRGLCDLHYQRGYRGQRLDGSGDTRIPGKGLKCSVRDCELAARSRGMCVGHYARWKQGLPLDTPLQDYGERFSNDYRRITEGGYVIVGVPENTPGSYLLGSARRTVMLEHRYVMQQHLGRPLLSEETPHHIYGDRADNRIENLELWSHRQPKGQRVVDKVAYAIEMLTLYPMFIGLDLVDQAALKTILDKVQGIGEKSVTRKRARKASKPQDARA